MLLTAWNEFRALDLQRLAGCMRRPLMADLRNVYAPDDVLAAGFVGYTSIGRAPRMKD